MKKILFFTLLTSLALFCSCNRCTKEKKVEAIVIEDLIEADTDIMNSKEIPFVWYETMILLDDYLDNEGKPEEVVNVFASITENDQLVYKFQHFLDGTCLEDSVQGLWIEDCVLVDSMIKVPYDSAYALVMKVNLPKPHSKNVCLRNPLGPKDCNPQWVFGNINSQIWVDATTGEIRKSNPAFPD